MKILSNFLITIMIAFTALFAHTGLYGHSGKPRYHVIVDTDGAIDDLRAVTTLLACNDVRVLAIIGSYGTLTAEASANKSSNLLKFFHHEGIPVGLGRSLNQELPFWCGFAGSVLWGDSDSLKSISYPESTSLLNEVTKSYPQKITVIALGALTNIANWLTANPEKVQHIDRIIWYNEKNLKQGFNYQVDPDSYQTIKKLPIPLQIVSNDRSDLICDQPFLNSLDSAGSVYSSHLAQIQRQIELSNPEKQVHLELGDDLVPLFLTCPIVFTTADEKQPSSFTVEKNIPATYIGNLLATLLSSGVKADNRVFIKFPVNPELYKKEAAEILQQTIIDYGMPEWKSVVLTNEIHGHTGIYSIIGVKMGIRALEYFNVGVNNLEAITYASNQPPLSCLNDGIQISTGATIGQGLIQIDKTVLPIPTVDFSFNGHKIRIELRKEIAERIEADISKGVQQFGMSEPYWLYVEKLAYRYWKELDRHEIFNIVTSDQ
ncbi:MAG: nucleoside hydrolase [Bacteroidales bacterium]|nr:nucleoside hydrolase [Bacteroidales bacterium]